MRKLLCSALVLLPVLAQAQTENFVLKGTVGAPAAVTKAYLGYAANKKWVLDSAVVKNGHFEFKGTLPEPGRASLTLSHQGTSLKQSKDMNREFFFLEKGTVAWSTPDSAVRAMVRGTPLNDEAAGLAALLVPLSARHDAIDKDFRAQPEAMRKDPTFLTQYKARLAPVETAQRQIRVKYVKAHPDAHHSLFVLMGLEGEIAETERFALYQGLRADVRNSPRGQRLGELIKNLQQVAVGTMAPDFTQNTPANVPVTLSSLRGKYVLIDFWAS